MLKVIYDRARYLMRPRKYNMQKCKARDKKGNICPGVTTYVIAWMLQTHSMAPSLIYTVSFSLRKIIQISVCQN